MPIRDLIGKEFPAFEMPVERGKIREFADAIGDDNPIYSDPAYAAKTEFRGILAPPTFTSTKNFWRKGESVWEVPGLDPRYRLHGEEEYEYFKPVLAGDVLTCRSKITEAYEKPGKRGGKMTFIVAEFTYYNQKGEKVAVSCSTTVQTEGAVKN
ncbi:MAG: MaoC family dehydratase N-terminal domain-containing protein [Deltaproteobacteria bacterium]|nr:MaoC family dehydratase N-terminal domain-containing protein [Deltaproteobacteria bacterium]